jgi:DMSO/TMAO reductase YedYZ molybdopterin-dependent catalytic subunit
MPREFIGHGRSTSTKLVPPGQYVESGFPVLSAGPTPRTALETWTFQLEYASEVLASWTWTQLLALPSTPSRYRISRP